MIEISDSTHVTGIDWEDGKMIVRFRDGSEYEYQDVSHGTFLEFLGAPSKGKFLNEVIKGNHEYSRRQ